MKKPRFTGIKTIKGLPTGDFREKQEAALSKMDATIEQARAELAYPNHSPEAALENYRAGYEIFDTNGDQW